jgi:hypothetical protein
MCMLEMKRWEIGLWAKHKTKEIAIDTWAREFFPSLDER